MGIKNCIRKIKKSNQFFYQLFLSYVYASSLFIGLVESREVEHLKEGEGFGAGRGLGQYLNGFSL